MTQKRLKQLKRERKETGRKMQNFMEAQNWKEAKRHYYWFHHLGNQIRKLQEDLA